MSEGLAEVYMTSSSAKLALLFWELSSFLFFLFKGKRRYLVLFFFSFSFSEIVWFLIIFLWKVGRMFVFKGLH